MPYTPSATVRAYDRRLDPQFGTIGVYQTGLNANYNSLTAKVEKRFSRGLTFLSSFTWSHGIDQGNVYLDGGTGGEAVTDLATTWDRSYERGSSSLDRRLSYNLSSIYELPFGKGKRYLQSGPGAWILGNWQIGGILALYSGMPQDHTFNVDNQNMGGKVRGDYVHNPNLPGSQRTIDQWFDTSFVTASAPGVLSNSARNLIIGPGTRNLDFILSRNFPMPWEGHRLQFRFESFNFTNTPQFGQPNTAVGSPTAGRITSAGDPRRIQFALKYQF